MNRVDWPLVIFLTCLGVLLYLFLTGEDDDDLADATDESMNDVSGWKTTLFEPEYHE